MRRWNVATPKDKVALHLEVAPSVRRRILELKELSEADSMTEVIRRALTLYEVALKSRAAGERLVIVHDKGQREVIMP